ncbi:MULTISPECIES: RluA family pseudouridine synthase [Synechococcaceae]|uniref:pseudouridine synthase n=1 Tax=Synechococcaceae TaxID=1890426 RepID=UPI0008FF6315|nr:MULTISPECIES: RluA family pseudouridine synthase [Synechococcaceae]APD47672.1 RNA pseudouridine synthase [Synechococcus sp. SynAce01]MCT0246321.1 RluA family pseudouridine synthase [Synechococcus sp. CS-601]MCT4366375.1 RluA family pseudouridine synthase [Candidatus Regnicoccus frigidus MAG-AL2]TWB90439.1 23S rRNA pseudouridine1911/1915/1917 synthase [Synechococcus sp. Ace-Pa]
MSEQWRPAVANNGWTYRDRIGPAEAGSSLSAFYAGRYAHSDQGVWAQRLAAGEVLCNGQRLRSDFTLSSGDRLQWQRPPWLEASVPDHWEVIHDDGDLLVIDKPSGLPVLPAGGYLEHTLLRLLERRFGGQGSGPAPRPVHRLGRFTSGLLVCARRSATRAWLSAQLRKSDPASCRKFYRALIRPGVLPQQPGFSRWIHAAIGRVPHPRLGQVWCAVPPEAPGALTALSQLTLIESRPEADLVEVAIVTGRPHQIRIHTASLGAPLLGDPLYRAGGGARDEALPGEGGYTLRAHRLRLLLPGGEELALEAPLPAALLSSGQIRSAARSKTGPC